MPELPEVQTTVNGLRQHVIGLRITDVWSDYNSPHYRGSDTIKDPAYFKQFRKQLIGRNVVAAKRRAKNILIHLGEQKPRSDASVRGGAGLPYAKTLLVHLKMTGHLLYGTYRFDSKKKKDLWEALEPESLKDAKNRHVHFLITFSNGKHLALSDVRKFAKVTLIDTHSLGDSTHLSDIGPEPLDKSFTFEKFASRLSLKAGGKIKQVLMDQSVIAGIGNIYADESLWRAGIHPAQKVSTIPVKDMKLLFTAMKHTLSKGIHFGGDSTSDYRNIHGEKGEFHETHHAYQRTGTKCDKKGCSGTIARIVLGGRGTHYCDRHQALRK